MKVPLFSINLALVGTMAFLVWDTTNTWLFTTDVPVEESSVVVTKQQEPEQESEQKKKRKHLRYYAMIGKKNLFRPEREEWKAPPPPPPQKPVAPPPPQEPEAPPPPPPLPNPTLDGIIILSETNKIALMKGSHREGASSSTPAQPTSNPRMPRIRHPSRPVSRYGRIVTEEVKRYHIGDEVSEMTVENILEDHVVLKRKGGEKVEIFLRTEEKTAKQVANDIQAKTPPPRSPVTKRPPSRRSSRFRRRSSRRPIPPPIGAK